MCVCVEPDAEYNDVCVWVSEYKHKNKTRDVTGEVVHILSAYRMSTWIPPTRSCWMSCRSSSRWAESGCIVSPDERRSNALIRKNQHDCRDKRLLNERRRSCHMFDLLRQLLQIVVIEYRYMANMSVQSVNSE